MTVSMGQMAIPFADMDRFERRSPGPRSRYAPVAAYLRAHPGEWRCIDRRPTPESALMLVRNARRGRPTVLAGMVIRVRDGFEVWACCPPDTETD
jgi:hypothetical protein